MRRTIERPRGRRRTAVALATAALAILGSLVACSGGDSPAAGAPARYGIGRAATDAEVSRWNHDIGPGGAELPPGRGSVAQGSALFQVKCAVCHGKIGEGMAPAFPALIGRDPKGEGFAFASDPKIVRTIGNYWPHATSLFDYVKRAMPQLAPGSLSDDEVYAVTAYLLAANRIIPDSTTLDAAGLRRVRMPARDRFVPDTRRGGADVK